MDFCPVGFLSQDYRTDLGIPVFRTSAKLDGPWNFKVWFDHFLLAVIVKENVSSKVLLEDPKAVLEKPIPRPETPRANEGARTIADREGRDKLISDRFVLENKKRRERGPKVGHNVIFIEIQKRPASRLFLALATEEKKNYNQKNTHTEVSTLEFREMVTKLKPHLKKRKV